MSGNRITLLGFAAIEALTHADGYGAPVNDGGAPEPADGANGGGVEAAYFDSPPLPVALVEGLDAQRIGKIGPLLGPGPAERPAHPHGEEH